MPIDNAGRLSAKLLRIAALKTDPGYSHGMLTVNADVLNADLLAFVESWRREPRSGRPAVRARGRGTSDPGLRPQERGARAR